MSALRIMQVAIWSVLGLGLLAGFVFGWLVGAG